MKLNRNTKKARGFIDSYNCSYNYTLSDCYDSYSQAKKRAYDYCLSKFVDMNGWRFRIISFNSQSFTCGWLYVDVETGLIMLNVETYRNTYTMEY